MPRPRRNAPPDAVLHVVNRGNDRKLLFANPQEYDDFLTLLVEVRERCPLRTLAYCLMPNHWHLVVWPSAAGEVSAFCHRLCCVHSIRHRRDGGTIGEGHVYQDRYRSFEVRSERQYYQVMSYVEGNALRAGLVQRAEAWPWSSLHERAGASVRLLDAGPLPLPADWIALVNESLPPDALAELRARRGRSTDVEGRRLPRPRRRNCGNSAIVVPDPT
jgi:putative transposase